MAHIRQSRPDSGLGFQAKLFKLYSPTPKQRGAISLLVQGHRARLRLGRGAVPNMAHMTQVMAQMFALEADFIPILGRFEGDLRPICPKVQPPNSAARSRSWCKGIVRGFAWVEETSPEPALAARVKLRIPNPVLNHACVEAPRVEPCLY